MFHTSQLRNIAVRVSYGRREQEMKNHCGLMADHVKTTQYTCQSFFIPVETGIEFFLAGGQGRLPGLCGHSRAQWATE